MKFLNKYYKKYKKYENEKFKYVSYPNVKFENYVISNYGQIINFKTNKILKPYTDKDGYLKIGLKCDDGRYHNIFIHRLVCWEFCKHKENFNIVNHIDANVKNNYYKNLEWTDVKGNTLHAIQMGLTVRSGTNTASSKYSQELIDSICEKLESGMTVHEIFKFYYPDLNVSDNWAFYKLIYSIRNGTTQVVNSSRYNIDLEKTKSKNKGSYDKQVCEKIYKLISEGKSTSEIIKIFGYQDIKIKDSKEKRHLYDKIRCQRTVYNNKNKY